MLLIGIENRLLSDVAGARFTHDIDLNLPGIFEFTLNLSGNVMCEHHHFIFRNLFRFNRDTNLASCLNRIGLINALECVSNGFQILKTLDIVLR